MAQAKRHHDSRKLKPMIIGDWVIDPTFSWLGSALLFSLAGFAMFQWFWPFIKKMWRNRKSEKKEVNRSRFNQQKKVSSGFY